MTTRTTADIARDILASLGKKDNRSTPASPARHTNAAPVVTHRRPEYQEVDALMENDPDNRTRRIAAAAAVFYDNKPYTLTKQGMVRREFDDHGSATRRAARELIDLHEYGKDRTHDPEGHPITEQSREANRHARALHDFAHEVNHSTMEETLPTNDGPLAPPGSEAFRSSADAVADAVIQRGRESQS